MEWPRCPDSCASGIWLRKGITMSPKLLGRTLVVLNVNDDPQAQLEIAVYSAFLDIENANSVETVQQMLHQRGNRGADIFLVDIDMEKTAIPRDLDWGIRS